jgi:hypothetical protein
MVFLVFWYLRWLRQPETPRGHTSQGSTRQDGTSHGKTSQDATTQMPVRLSPKARKQLLLSFVLTTLVLAIALNYNTKLLLHSYASFQAFLRLTVLLSGPLLLAQMCLYSLVWHLIASRQFSYNGEPSTAKVPKSEPQPSSGEYSLRFSGDMQEPVIKQPRPSGEYSIRGPR